MTFRVTGLSKLGVNILASFQKLLTNGNPDGDPFSVTLLPTVDGATYTKNSLPRGTYEMEVCEDGKQSWLPKVKFTVAS